MEAGDELSNGNKTNLNDHCTSCSVDENHNLVVEPYRTVRVRVNAALTDAQPFLSTPDFSDMRGDYCDLNIFVSCNNAIKCTLPRKK